MANPSWVLSSFFFFVVILTASTASRSILDAPSPSPSPMSTPDCTLVIYDMVDCLDFVSDGSNQTKPTSSCCSAVGSVISVSPLCLCDGLEEAANLGFAINATRAVPLPSLCSYVIPADQLCHVPEVEPQAPSASPSQSPSYSLSPERYPSPAMPPLSPPSPALDTPPPASTPASSPSSSDEPLPESAASTLVPSMVAAVALLVASFSCL